MSGAGPGINYTRTPDDELVRLCQVSGSDGFDELIWALIYRGGPQSLTELADKYGDSNRIETALGRLLKSGRVEHSDATGAYQARPLVVPFGSAVGWEAAVFDHFQAMVQTITCRLRAGRTAPSLEDRIGGSTYTFEVWPGHPFESEAYATLATLWSKLGELRREIERYNAKHEAQENAMQVSLYVGQCVIPQENGEFDDNL